VVAVSATTSTGGGPVLGAKTPIASVTCPAGHPKLVGGGANANGGGTSVGAVEFSMPNPNTDTATPTGWQAQAVVTNAGTGAVTVIAYAVCGV
jgi:hypothetical protein